MGGVLLGGLTVVTALLAVLVAGVLRSHAEILRSLHELGVNLDPHDDVPFAEPGRAVQAGVPGRRASTGAAGGDVEGQSPNGAAVHVGVVGARTPTLLAFLSSSCLTCRTFWTEFADEGLEVPSGGRLVIVTQSADMESPSAIAELAPPSVTAVLSTPAWIAYDVPGAPYFVLVDTDGSILGEGAATSWERVRDLLARARADRAHLNQRDRELLIDDMLERASIDQEHPTVRPAPR